MIATTEPQALDPFGLAEARYRALAEERRLGRLEARRYRQEVLALAVADAEGRQWVLGPEDGCWYRAERGGWTAGEPPRRLVCPECGHHNLLRHSFCVECGGRLARRADQ